jgi:DHA1 family multidrug resistance protein-like MFS transporter
MYRDLILIAIALMMWGIGEGMTFIFQPLYLEQLGADPILIGTILGVSGVAMTVLHIPAGYLSDKIGRRKLLLIAWTSGMVTTWIMALANTLPVFVLGMVFYGFTAFVISPLNSYITAARGKLGVGRALTLISAAYNTGAILGPFLGGIIAERYGLRQIYYVSASIFIFSTITLFFIRSQPIEHDDQRSGFGIHIDRRIISFLVIVFLAMFAMYLSQPLSSIFLQNERGLSFSEIGRLGSISSIGIVTLNLFLGNLNARMGFLLGQMCVAIFTVLLWNGTGFNWYAIGYFLLGGFRVSRSMASAQMRALVHQSRMGLAYGLTETVGSSAYILAPPLAGFLYNIQPTLMYTVSFLLILVSILIGYLFLPKPQISIALNSEKIISQSKQTFRLRRIQKWK